MQEGKRKRREGKRQEGDQARREKKTETARAGGRKKERKGERKKERKKKTGTPEAAAAYFSAGDRVGLVLSLRFMKWMNTAMLVRLFQDAPAKLTDLGITM